MTHMQKTICTHMDFISFFEEILQNKVKTKVDSSMESIFLCCVNFCQSFNNMFGFRYDFRGIISRNDYGGFGFRDGG